LVSDGYFHAGGWAAVVVGLFLFADLQRRGATVPRRMWAGGLIGWGGFQLYDGLFQHKVLGLPRCAITSTCCPTTWSGTLPAASAPHRLLLLRSRARSGSRRQ